VARGRCEWSEGRWGEVGLKVDCIKLGDDDDADAVAAREAAFRTGLTAASGVARVIREDTSI